MTHPEKYARPGVYLDEDDHGRLLDENREQYRRERREELLQKRRRIDRQLRAMEGDDV